MNRFRKSCLSQYLQSRELVKANCRRRFEADQALKLSRKKKSTSRLTIRIMYLRHCESQWNRATVAVTTHSFHVLCEAFMRCICIGFKWLRIRLHVKAV